MGLGQTRVVPFVRGVQTVISQLGLSMKITPPVSSRFQIARPSGQGRATFPAPPHPMAPRTTTEETCIAMELWRFPPGRRMNSVPVEGEGMKAGTRCFSACDPWTSVLFSFIPSLPPFSPLTYLSQSRSLTV